jgi:threonine/homoserine/homoserine lactone efflux protein
MSHFLGFVVLAAVVIVTPGPDTALTIRNALRSGRRGGMMTGAGVATGQAGWAVATSVGLATLLQLFRPAYIAIQLAGAAYLIYLGGHSLWMSRRASTTHHQSVQPTRRRFASNPYTQGLLSNLGNPKMAVFFLSLLPQFVPSGPQTFLPLLSLGLTFAAMTWIWLTAYSIVVAKVGDLLRRQRVRRALDALTGAALVVLGIRVVTETV